MFTLMHWHAKNNVVMPLAFFRVLYEILLSSIALNVEDFFPWLILQSGTAVWWDMKLKKHCNFPEGIHRQSVNGSSQVIKKIIYAKNMSTFQDFSFTSLQNMTHAELWKEFSGLRMCKHCHLPVSRGSQLSHSKLGDSAILDLWFSWIPIVVVQKKIVRLVQKWTTPNTKRVLRFTYV